MLGWHFIWGAFNRRLNFRLRWLCHADRWSPILTLRSASAYNVMHYVGSKNYNDALQWERILKGLYLPYIKATTVISRENNASTLKFGTCWDSSGGFTLLCIDNSLQLLGVTAIVKGCDN